MGDTLAELGYRPHSQELPAQRSAAADSGTRKMMEHWHRLIALRRQMIKALQDAGAGLVVGTDYPRDGKMPGAGVHRELAALVAAGLTPYQALAAATRNVAALLGTLDSAGTVAVGRRADLVLLEGNPLVDIQATRRAAGVMVAGRWLSRQALDQGLAKYATAATKP
jgi:imidazolonepropionase-like amidohydrolase